MKKTLSKLVLALMATAVIATAVPLTASADDDFDACPECPKSVVELTSTPLDAAVALEWSESSDDVAVTGYRVYYGTASVTDTDQEYDSNVDAGMVTEYTISDLENDTTYYFSVVAYDADNNESPYWSPEAESTPEAGLEPSGDSEGPQVSDVEALNSTEVSVEFSEAVVLPETDPQDAFSIENDDSFEALEVSSVTMDEDDTTKKTVIVTTAEQEDGASYTLTVSSALEDEAGNPVESGITDQGTFTGSGEVKAAEDVEAPRVVDVEAQDDTHVVVNFNEAILLSIDPSENFEIVQSDDGSASLEVLEVVLGANTENIANASAVITTSAQEAANYTLSVTGVTDEAENDIDATSSVGTFTGMGEEEVVTPPDEDTDPDEDIDTDPDEDTDTVIPGPKDVAKLLAKSVMAAGKYNVTLTWAVPDTNKGQISEQVVYMSEDSKDYDKKASLDADAEKYEAKGLKEGDYWFKVTQKDVEGNETEGTITKIVLTETGPGLVGLVLVSLGLGKVVTRKNK